VEDISKLSLSDLTTTNSLKFFERSGIKSDFLHTPVAEWKNNASYQKERQVIASLRVVNDHAERVVKLMSDLNRSLTKDEQSFKISF